MPLIYFTPFRLILVDILAWLVIHLGISYLLRQVDDGFFERNKRWFRPFSFEKSGDFWQKKFRIKAWKDRLPDGTVIAKNGFDKSKLANNNIEYLKQFVIETQRAELTHWFLIPPAFLFFLWNPTWAGGVMVIYALVVNLPFIMIQRYNRPRLERVLNKIKN